MRVRRARRLTASRRAAARAKPALAGKARRPVRGGPDPETRKVCGFAADVRAEDVNAIMRIYATDGLFVFDVVPPRQYVGVAAYRKDWTGLLASMKGPDQDGHYRH